MKKNKKGLSIIETLVVITVFALLAAVIAQSVALSLRGARKSDSSSEVRENLDFAMSIIERNVRNARTITSTCDGNPILVGGVPTLEYEDDDESAVTISCPSVGVDGNVIDTNGKLTSDNISITACEFTCTKPSTRLPERVEINITGQKKNAPTIEQSSITVETTVNLRVY